MVELSSPVKAVGVAVLLLVGTVVGALALGVIGAPSVVSVENHFGEVNETTSVIVTEMVIHNPNPIGVQLGGLTVDYAVMMNDVRMAEGTNEGLSIGTGNSTVRFHTGLNNSKIPAWWVSHISNGEHTELRVNASVHSSLLGRTFDVPTVTRDIDTSLIEAFRTEKSRPITVDAVTVSNPVMILKRTDASWGTVNAETTEVRMTLYLSNPNPYPITLTSIGYDITMNGIPVGRGEAGHTTVIPPGETVPVEAITRIDTQKLDEWWVPHLQRNQVTELRLQLYLTFDLSAVGLGEQRIKLDEFTRIIETDIFGAKNATDTGADVGSEASNGNDGGNSAGVSSTGGDGTDDSTMATPTGTATDESGGGSTPPPTRTPVSTADEGSTPTDDGGLL